MTYGSTVGEDSPSSAAGGGPQQNQNGSFSFAENGNQRNEGSVKGNRNDRGLKIILLCMAVFAVSVTLALIIQTATGVHDDSAQTSVYPTDQAVSDHELCTGMANYVLSKGGNAVDAVVAAQLCLALWMPHITGLGGGGMMLIYKHRTEEADLIDFRETAPSGKAEGQSSGVPGYLRGLLRAHEKHGSGVRGRECCSWLQLVYLAVRDADGVAKAGEHFNNATETKGQRIKPGSRLSNFAATKGEFSDDLSYRQLLGLFRQIAEQKDAAFYTGEVAEAIKNETGGKITLEDLENYEVVERKPERLQIGKYGILASGLPTGGTLVLAFLNAFQKLVEESGGQLSDDSPEYVGNVSTILRNTKRIQLSLGEMDQSSSRKSFFLASKNAGALLTDQQKSESSFPFGAEYEIPEPVGAAAAAFDKTDTYVASVTSLNTWFGSGQMTSHGVILNNALNNFAPASSKEDTFNLFGEGRRPLTMNSAVVAFDTERPCGSRFAFAGATADFVAQTVARAVLLDESLSEAVSGPRLYADPKGDSLWTEGVFSSFSETLAPYLRDVKYLKVPFTSVEAIKKRKDEVFVSEDPRAGIDVPSKYANQHSVCPAGGDCPF